jgi:peptidoglycan/LPS O-acetylase OafA/YrhL
MSTQRFYGNLEALRGIAALLVAFYHLQWNSHLRGLPALQNAWSFVDLFFVLSGFVIALAYVDRLKGWRDVPDFMRRRFFRLYPLHLVTVVVMLALVAARYAAAPADTVAKYGIDGSWISLILSNLTLTQAMGWTDRAILNIPSWSISTEFFAYLVFAGVCVVMPSRRWRIAGMGMVSILGFAVIALAVGSLEAPLHLRFLRCLYGFGLGVGVFWLVDRSPFRLAPDIAIVIQLTMLALLVMMLSGLSRNSPWLLLLPVVDAALITAMALDESSWIKRALECRAPLFLGRVSYSIYMIHVPIVAVIGAVVARLWHGDLWAIDPRLGDALTILFIVTLLAVAYVTYTYIEAPWRERGRRPGRERRTQTRTDEATIIW